LQPHTFQLLLHLALLLVELVLSLLLLLKQLFQVFLLSKCLLITAALRQDSALQSRTRICLFGANRCRKKRQNNRGTDQPTTWFHRDIPPFSINTGVSTR